MAVMNSDALMISLEDGTVQKVYSLEEEEVMVMVAVVVVVVVVMMIFSLTLCLKKKNLGVILLFVEEATPHGNPKPLDKVMCFWHVILKQSRVEQFADY